MCEVINFLFSLEITEVAHLASFFLFTPSANVRLDPVCSVTEAGRRRRSGDVGETLTRWRQWQWSLSNPSEWI